LSELADLLVRCAPEYLRRHQARMPRAQQRALTAIQQCRTPALGGQLYRCSACGQPDFAYHSCHHRACPRCGGGQTAAWTQRQTERLLPVPYFLVTFTLPAPLRPLTQAQPELLHDLLFAQAAAALQTVAAEPRHLGAELGFLGVLHTWTRQLAHHPHVHFIVAGGGLRPDRKKWRRCRRPDWLLPVQALSARFRQGMEVALRAAAPALHAQVPDACWRGPWVVHSQPAGSGEPVVRYLARYVFRTAISDARIVAINEQAVRFRYTDSRSGRKQICRLPVEEFLRRYLLHVLPSGQHRVRYFGWMHPAAKRRRWIVETVLAALIVVRAPTAPPSWHLCCPHCGAFALVPVARIARSTNLGQARAPPVCQR
jgi:hypothetical protein